MGFGGVLSSLSFAGERKGAAGGKVRDKGFFPAPTFSEQMAYTPHTSLHQPAAGPPPFRQGGLWNGVLQEARCRPRWATPQSAWRLTAPLNKGSLWILRIVTPVTSVTGSQ